MAQRTALIVAILSSFVAFLDGSVVNLALPAIEHELGGGVALQQWVLDGYLLALSSLILVAGSMSDSLGRVRVLRWGLLAFAVGTLLCTFALSAPMIVGARIVQGAGAALLVPSSLALINATFDADGQPRAIGTWTAWTGTAFVAGPLIGGIIVDTLGWRLVFLLSVIPVLPTLYLTTRLPADHGPGSRRIDVVGATLTAIGLGGTVVALIEGQRLGYSAVGVVVPLVVGLLALAAMPWWERRAAHPILPLEIFAVRNFAVTNLATLAIYAAIPLGMLIVTLYLQEDIGTSATLAGLATLPVPVISLLFSSRIGALSARFGPRIFMTVGPLTAAVGFALMRPADDGFNFWTQLLPGLVVFGVGLTVTVTPLTATVLSALGPDRSGVASAAVNNAASRIAGLVSVAFVGVLVGGHVDDHGFRVVTTACAVLLVVGAAIAAAGIRNAGVVGPIDPDARAQCRDRAGN